jgi:hypothetical protein
MERTLHRDCYFSPEIFQQEKEQIFCRLDLRRVPARS